MTPQERALVTGLFDRLASLENAQRDPEAERQIAEGRARAPNAIYALVQTVLLQDEALKQADARIRELESHAGGSTPGGGFLDSLRGLGAGRGSVPAVPPASKWNSGGHDSVAAAAPQAAPEQLGRGGSFLGTAAAAAVGVIGGSLLFNGLHNMLGGGRAQAFGTPGDDRADGGRPWDNDASRGELARDAGLNDIGGRRSASADDGKPAGLFDGDAGDNDQLFSDDNDLDSGDFGGGDT